MAVVSDFFPLIKAALLRRGLSEKPQWPPLQCVILAAVTIYQVNGKVCYREWCLVKHASDMCNRKIQLQ